MKHNVTLEDYLHRFECHNEFYSIENLLRKQRAKNSPWSIEYYVHRGLNIEQAKEKISELKARRKVPSTSPAYSEHWIKKGFTDLESEKKSKEYRNSIGKLPTLESYLKRYGENIGTQKWNKFKSKISLREDTSIENLRASGYSLQEAKIIRSRKKGSNRQQIDVWKSFNSYRKAVDFLTHITKTEFDLEGKDGEALDHMYSCYGGWYNKISPFVIASVYNLRYIAETENIQKGQFCIITKEELLDAYNKNTKKQIQEGAVWEEYVNAFINNQ